MVHVGAIASGVHVYFHSRELTAILVKGQVSAATNAFTKEKNHVIYRFVSLLYYLFCCIDV